METNKDILDKIHKLLKLAESNPNESEAKAAMAKVTTLMSRYNLSENDVKEAIINEIPFKSLFSVSTPKDWETAIAVVTGEAFGCVTLWRAAKSQWRDNYGRFILVGVHDQSRLAEYCLTVLMRGVQKGRTRLNDELNQKFPGMPRQLKKKHLDGYCWGYFSQIVSKLNKFKNPDAIELLLKDYTDKTTDGKEAPVKESSQELGHYGYQAGIADAKKQDLHRPMNGGEETLAIGGGQ